MHITSRMHFIAIVFGWLGSSPALGDVVTAQWVNNTNFFYEVTHMPDFDQRRAAGPGTPGLPSNGGMYCAPTATLNMMAYAANHGFPLLAPGPASWQSPANYNTATAEITAMGSFMGTHPTEGTGGGGWIDGTNLWLADSGHEALFTTKLHYHTGLLGPNLNLIAQKAIQGSLVAPAYGRYQRIGTVNGFPLFDRTGGHVVTLARAERIGQSQKLWVRDPADDAANTTQSTFMNRLWNVTNVLVYVQTDDGNVQRLFSALDYDPPGTGDTVRFIDGIVTMRPNFGLTFVNTGNTWSLVLVQPFAILGFNQTPSQIDLKTTGPVLDGIVNSEQTEGFVLQHADGTHPTLHRIDLATRETQPLAELPGGSQIALSPHPAVYIMSDAQLQCLDLTEEVPAVQTVELPLPGDAVAYDNFRNEVLVLSVSKRRVMRYEDIGIIPCIEPIPDSIPLEGLAKVTIDSTTGLYWVLSQATHRLHGWGMNAAGGPVFDEAELPGNLEPLSLDFDDRGHMFVSHADGVMELRSAGKGEGWMVVPDSAFADAPPGVGFRISKSESNFDPNLHDGPGWENLDPDELTFGEEVLDCDSDLTHNGVTEVNDLLLVINEWGACPTGPCAADATGDRLVNVDDLLVVINGWGNCP